jgi:hypothetical protein
MSEKAKVTTKAPEAKRENIAFQTRKPELSQSIGSPIDYILHLHQTIGNQAVERLFKSGVIQAKLKIGQPNDIYEQEADRIADEVMQMPNKQHIADSSLRPIAYGHSFSSIDNKPYAISHMPKLKITPLIQRQVEEEEEEEILQTKEIPGQTPEVTPNLEYRINALKGGGQPLPESVRAFFEPRFGYDFSQVRVHTETQAAESAQALSAVAYTVGRDIVFGAGQYTPDTTTGRRFLAHELTHVVQQRQKNDSNGSLQLRPAGRARTESLVLKDVPFDPDPRRELFFEAKVLKKLSDKLTEVRIPAPWGPDLMWKSNFHRGVYRKLLAIKPTPKTADIAVDFIKGTTLEGSYLLFAIVHISMVPPSVAEIPEEELPPLVPVKEAQEKEPKKGLEKEREEGISLPSEEIEEGKEMEFVSGICQSIGVVTTGLHIGELALHSLEALAGWATLAEGLALFAESMIAVLEAMEAGRKWGGVMGASYAIVAIAHGQEPPPPGRWMAEDAKEGWDAQASKVKNAMKDALMKNPQVFLASMARIKKMDPNQALDQVYLYLCEEQLQETFLFFPIRGGLYRRATEVRLIWPGPEMGFR